MQRTFYFLPCMFVPMGGHDVHSLHYHTAYARAGSLHLCKVWS